MAQQSEYSLIDGKDFENLQRLAEVDPDGFESRREELIDAFIEKLPAETRHRMRCLQWRIDRTRDQAKSPAQSCAEISEMMWESFCKLNQALQRIHADRKDRSRSASKIRQEAEVIPFHC